MDVGHAETGRVELDQDLIRACGREIASISIHLVRGEKSPRQERIRTWLGNVYVSDLDVEVWAFVYDYAGLALLGDVKGLRGVGFGL